MHGKASRLVKVPTRRCFRSKETVFILTFIGCLAYFYIYREYLSNNVTHVFYTTFSTTLSTTFSTDDNYSIVEHFGDYNSIHLVQNVCIDETGIHYIETENNKLFNNISSFPVHTDIRSSYHHINIKKFNNSNSINIVFLDKPIAYLLWISVSNNLYHFMFSLIGGFKAINLIKQLHINLNINDIQIINYGGNKIKHHTFEKLYDGILTNLSKYPT
eukprot:446077_1